MDETSQHSHDEALASHRWGQAALLSLGSGEQTLALAATLAAVLSVEGVACEVAASQALQRAAKEAFRSVHLGQLQAEGSLQLPHTSQARCPLVLRKVQAEHAQGTT